MSNTRQQLLALKKDFAPTTVEIEGVKVVIKKPTVLGRKQITQKATVTDDKDGFRFDSHLFSMYAILECCYDEQGSKVFEPTDLGELESRETGSFVDQLAEEVMKVMYIETESKKKD